MPQFENARTTAEAIGRITCIKTGEEIGLLYQWDNGETQAALFEENQSLKSGVSRRYAKSAIELGLDKAKTE